MNSLFLNALRNDIRHCVKDRLKRVRTARLSVLRVTLQVTVRTGLAAPHIAFWRRNKHSEVLFVMWGVLFLKVVK